MVVCCHCFIVLSIFWMSSPSIICVGNIFYFFTYLFTLLCFLINNGFSFNEVQFINFSFMYGWCFCVCVGLCVCVCVCPAWNMDIQLTKHQFLDKNIISPMYCSGIFSQNKWLNFCGSHFSLFCSMVSFMDEKLIRWSKKEMEIFIWVKFEDHNPGRASQKAPRTVPPVRSQGTVI